jgi:TonB family protein
MKHLALLVLLGCAQPETALRGCPDEPIARVGGADQAPVLIRRVEPDFGNAPAIQGIVIVETIVTRDGTVCAARVLRGLDPAIDAAALKAVRQWRFVPAQKNGKPVQAAYSLTVAVRSGAPASSPAGRAPSRRPPP